MTFSCILLNLSKISCACMFLCVCERKHVHAWCYDAGENINSSFGGFLLLIEHHKKHEIVFFERNHAFMSLSRIQMPCIAARYVTWLHEISADGLDLFAFLMMFINLCCISRKSRKSILLEIQSFLHPELSAVIKGQTYHALMIKDLFDEVAQCLFLFSF